ncbi:MAG: helix-turn-helix domain-containing protein [Defluviitaleaceae bacterium]|nr:helix-turn-helix domain-containing protein [Defluviitaleaceae bacterium]MCL2263901.1 helix-turn-helix domain-containing protein [Defluviitaleaceae bacterium]
MNDVEKSTEKKPRLLTLKEAAQLIDGLTEYRVRQLCAEGIIKYHKFGNKYMIPERELLKYFGELS